MRIDTEDYRRLRRTNPSAASALDAWLKTLPPMLGSHCIAIETDAAGPAVTITHYLVDALGKRYMDRSRKPHAPAIGKTRLTPATSLPIVEGEGGGLIWVPDGATA